MFLEGRKEGRKRHDCLASGIPMILIARYLMLRINCREREREKLSKFDKTIRILSSMMYERRKTWMKEQNSEFRDNEI